MSGFPRNDDSMRGGPLTENIRASRSCPPTETSPDAVANALAAMAKDASVKRNLGSAGCKNLALKSLARQTIIKTPELARLPGRNALKMRADTGITFAEKYAPLFFAFQSHTISPEIKAVQIPHWWL